MISIISCTKRREPKFEWLADSLARCLVNTTVAIELIVVDGLLTIEGDYEAPWTTTWRDRREQLALAIKGRFSYRHVDPKPTPWQGRHRKTRRDFYALNNARNTGLALARGDYVCFVDDCTVLDQDWLLYHAAVAARSAVGLGGFALAGSYRSYTRATVEYGQVVTGELHPMGEDRRGGGDARVCTGGWLWGLNMGFPLRAAFGINGFDELFDGQAGSEDADAGVRLERFGCTIIHEPRCLINQILETHEPVCGQATWGDTQMMAQKELRLKDGKNHFANEKLIEELFEDPTRIKPRGNDFDLQQLHRDALLTGLFPTERATTHDWRDGKRLEDC